MSATPAATLRLTRFAAKCPPLQEQQTAWPLSVVCEGFGGIPSEVFVYQISKRGDPIKGDKFQCVASVNQLYELPVGEGALVSTLEGVWFYRSATMLVVCRSASEAQCVWDQLVWEANSLAQNWSAAQNLVAVATADVSQTVVQYAEQPVNPPIRLQLFYQPAGTPTLGGGGSGYAAVAAGAVTNIIVTIGGANYALPPYVVLIGGGGSGASATAVVSGGIITQINVTAAGAGYAYAPNVFIIPQQGITSPDPTQPGWLPASAAAALNYAVPAGGAFFYNIQRDPNLTAVWPPAQPFNATHLFRNGTLMPYGSGYFITQDTIWWLAFNPLSLAGRAQALFQSQDNSAPWPQDYISPSNPGTSSPNLTIVLYQAPAPLP